MLFDNNFLSLYRNQEGYRLNNIKILSLNQFVIATKLTISTANIWNNALSIDEQIIKMSWINSCNILSRRLMIFFPTKDSFLFLNLERFQHRNVLFVFQTDFKEENDNQSGFDEEAKYTLSTHGSCKLIRNGYSYFKYRVNKNDTFWRCNNKKNKGCKGKARTRRIGAKEMMKLCGMHNHLPDSLVEEN